MTLRRGSRLGPYEVLAPLGAGGLRPRPGLPHASAAREARLAGAGKPISNGRMNTMKTTIDRAGRLVLPKPIREAAGISPGSELTIRVADGRIEIEPAPLEVKLVKRGNLTVAVPRKSTRPLTERD